ncbi:hypothetical protein BT69DRAFT_782239 [Atractiella rhizophila]|nr:hypothetical protein BT69DRAFT_782239 [Atractiella rhizophila]
MEDVSGGGETQGEDDHGDVEGADWEVVRYDEPANWTPRTPLVCEGYAYPAAHPLTTPARSFPPLYVSKLKRRRWSFTSDGVGIFLHSTTCARFGSEKNTIRGFVCQSCRELSHDANVERIKLSANRKGAKELEYLNWDYKTPDQQHESLKVLRKKAVRLHSKVSYRDSRIESQEAKIKLQNEVLHRIASTAYPRVNPLLLNCIMRKYSLERTLAQISAAEQGRIKAYSYLYREYLVGLLVYRLGSQTLLSILHVACGLPSARSIKRFVSGMKLWISIDLVKREEVVHNLDTFHRIGRDAERELEEALEEERERENSGGSDRIIGSRGNQIPMGQYEFQPGGKVTRPTGFGMFTDETVLNQTPGVDINTMSVVGICAHAKDWNKVVEDESVLWELQEGLAKEEIHAASLLSYWVYGRYGREEYSPRPLSLSGTCRTGPSVTEELDTFEIHISALHGWLLNHHPGSELWTLASDGDSTRREAGDIRFSRRTLHAVFPDFHLYLPAALVGFNYCCDAYGVVMVFDPLHLVKRMCSWLERKGGIMVGQVTVYPMTLLAHLQACFPDFTVRQWELLFFDKDKMNVPRAYTLAKRTTELRHVNEPFDTTRNRSMETKAYQFIGTILHCALISPFFDVRLSLTEQLEQLTEAMVLMTIGFRSAKSRFIPWQILHDFLATATGAWVYAARSRRLDPTLEVLLIQLGTDRLEQLFGVLRTVVRGNCSFDMLQAAISSVAAFEVCDILASNPELKPRDKRRDVRPEDEDLDHISVRVWVGEVFGIRGGVKYPWAFV